MKIDQPIINYTTEYETLRMFFKEFAAQNNFVDNRKKENIIIKHSFFVVATELTSLSLAAIGSILNKDHSTVLHAKRNHNDNMRFLSNYKNIYNSIYKSLCLNLEVYRDVEDAESIIELKELRFRLVQISQKLRNTMLDASELNSKNKLLMNHNKSLHDRNIRLEKELSRVKNLL